MNALVDQGFDVNVMPLSIYKRLTDERPAETDIRLSLASHSYIYHLGIVEDVLVDVVGYVYPVDFVILDIKEDEKRPFILGTPFLTTAKVVIKFDKGTITLRSRKSKISFHKIPEPHCRIEKGIKKDIEPIAPMMTGNSGRGLILYQAYGNLYAMTALGWLLEEIHVTWAQLEKKRTRLRLYTKYLEEIHTEHGDGVANYARRLQKIQEKASWISRQHNIEHLAKYGEKSVFWSINDKDRGSLLNLKNTTYHSRRIHYILRLRQDQYHCLTLKNTSYPHQQIRRIRYFGQHSDKAQFPSNTPYPEAPIPRVQWRLVTIHELNNHGAHSKLLQYGVSDPFDRRIESL
ncbi:MAK10-like protein [Tanacetum coccineum]